MSITSYQRAGLHGAHLLEIDGLEHALPDADGLARALGYIGRS